MQLPFDGHYRRRLYLVRHGQAAASKAEHGLYGDGISLTETGRQEAEAMRDALAGVAFEAAYCSDIQRAQETADIILGPHKIRAVASKRFTEIRGDIASALMAEGPREEKLAGFAYSLWREEADQRFLGGERLNEYLGRAAATLVELVVGASGSNILIVSHSGFQRAALCWALDSVPLGFAKLEQDSCCLNILDIDVTANERIVRKHIRLANFTPLDPVKVQNRLTDGERLALRLSDELARARPP